jgi:hypothetical protein
VNLAPWAPLIGVGGVVLGAVLGFVSAELRASRDEQRRRAAAGASLAATLASAVRHNVRVAEGLTLGDLDPEQMLSVPARFELAVYHALLPRLGDLPAEQIDAVSAFYRTVALAIQVRDDHWRRRESLSPTALPIAEVRQGAWEALARQSGYAATLEEIKEEGRALISSLALVRNSPVRRLIPWKSGTR